MTPAAARLAELEDRQARLADEKRSAQARTSAIEARAAELERLIDQATSVDALRALEAELAELRREARVLENRRPTLTDEILRTGLDVDAARRDAATEAVALVMLEAEPILDRVRAACDELVELRRQAVAAGAPEHLLPPAVGWDGRVRATTSVTVFRMADALLEALVGDWVKVSLPEARKLVGT